MAERSRFQTYRLKRKMEFEKLKRFENFAKQHFPQMWQLFEQEEQNEKRNQNMLNNKELVETDDTLVVNDVEESSASESHEARSMESLISEVWQNIDPMLTTEEIVNLFLNS